MASVPEFRYYEEPQCLVEASAHVSSRVSDLALLRFDPATTDESCNLCRGIQPTPLARCEVLWFCRQTNENGSAVFPAQIIRFFVVPRINVRLLQLNPCLAM